MLTFLKIKIDGKGRFLRRVDPQIFDLLQLSRTERESKTEFLKLKKNLQKTNGRYEREENFSVKIVLRSEAMLLRKKAQEAVLFYRLVRRERIRLFQAYIECLPLQKQFLRNAA